MKTAKITDQNEHINSKIKQNTQGRNFSESESKYEEDKQINPNTVPNPNGQSHQSESESELESESGSDDNYPNSSSRYSFFNKLKDPKINLDDLLSGLKNQKQMEIIQRNKLIDQLEEIESHEKVSNDLIILEHNQDNNASKKKQNMINQEIQVSSHSYGNKSDKLHITEIIKSKPKFQNGNKNYDYSFRSTKNLRKYSERYE